VAQQNFASKYYWAGQGHSNGPRWWMMTNKESVGQMMRAAMKRARVARAMTMVIRMAGDKVSKAMATKVAANKEG
jgi:hypothetical protein